MTGWFASSSASEEKPSPISRESRQACWNTRDAFFQCLNTNGVDIPPSTFTPKNVGKGGACEAALKDYEANCARSWVEYFNKRRVLEIRQRKTVEAAEKDRNTAFQQQTQAATRGQQK